MRYFEINEGIRMGSRELSNIGLDNFTIGFEFEVELYDGFSVFGDENFGSEDDEIDIEAAAEAHREHWLASGGLSFAEWFEDDVNIGEFILENNLTPVYGWVEDVEDYVEHLNAEEQSSYRKRIAGMRKIMKKYSDEFIDWFKNFYENEYKENIIEDTERIKELVLYFQMNNPKNINRFAEKEREQLLRDKLDKLSEESVKYFFWHDFHYFSKVFYLRADEPTYYTVDDIDFNEKEYIYDEYDDIINIRDDIEDLDDLVKYFKIDENEVMDILGEDYADADDERRRDDFDIWLEENGSYFMVGNSDTVVSYVRNMVEDLGYNWDVVTDGSLNTGAEIKSDVFDNIEDGFRSMKEIFNMISEDEFMHTSERTGFHINIGTWRGTEIDNMDWLKFLVVYRSGRLLDEFRRRMNTFSSDKLGEIIESLEKMNLRPFYNNIDTVNSIVIGSSTKNSAINLSKLRNDGIIEIRAVGNSGYENKADYIISEVKKIILALEVASDREAYVREYAKKLYKLLYSAYNKRVGRSDNSVKDFFKRITGGVFDYEYLRAYDMIKFIIRSGFVDSIKSAGKFYTSKVHKNIIDDLREYSRINGVDVKGGIEDHLDKYDETGEIRNSKFISSILKSL